MKTYRIKDWDKHFENNRTRELKKMDWVPVRNKHDGDGFTELLDHKNGMAHYGAWLLIVQVASKCVPRGTLCRDIPQDGAATCGTPHDSASLARLTRANPDVFEEAIPRLIKIGWLEVTYSGEEPSENPAQIPHNPAPRCGEVTMERKGTEGKGITLAGESEKLVEQIYQLYPRHLDPAKAKVAIRKAIDKHGPELVGSKTAAYAKVVETFLPAKSARDYIPYPASWFNAEGFLSDPAEWEANCRHYATRQMNNGAARPPSISDLKTILQAKQSKRDELKRRYAHESPLGDEWTDQGKRQEFSVLGKEMKEITNKIASYA